MAEVSGDFLVNARGMKQCGGAMKECDERKTQLRVAVRRAAKLQSELRLDEFERRHMLFAGEGDGPVFGDEAVIVGMGREEIERAAASIEGRARSPNGGEKIEASAAAEQREKIALVRKAFVKRRGRGASGAGHGAHGEGRGLQARAVLVGVFC